MNIRHLAFALIALSASSAASCMLDSRGICTKEDNAECMGGSGGGGGADSCASAPEAVDAVGIGKKYGLYLHDNLGDEQYFNDSTPGSISLTGQLPAELVVAGKDGVSIDFNGSKEVFYSVDPSAVSDCDNQGFYSQQCLKVIAHHYRCLSGSSEPDCSGTQATFTLIGTQSSYSMNQSSRLLILASLLCQQ